MIRDRMIEYYEKRAPEYDKIYFRDNPARQAELSEMYRTSQEWLSGRTILDLACGTGFWTKVVSEAALSVTGVDINPATLREAERKSYKCPVSLIKGDIYRLPFSAGYFDGLLCTYLVSHVRRQDLKALGRNLKGILKPGSPAFICDNNLICELKPELIFDDERINTYKIRRLENGEEFMILKNYFEKGELEAIFADWGRLNNLTYKEYYWAAQLTF